MPAPWHRSFRPCLWDPHRTNKRLSFRIHELGAIRLWRAAHYGISVVSGICVRASLDSLLCRVLPLEMRFLHVLELIPCRVLCGLGTERVVDCMFRRVRFLAIVCAVAPSA